MSMIKHKKLPKWLPGDPSDKKLLHSMLRVDHAGEYGAVCIYRGQIDAVANSKHCKKIGARLRSMYNQELAHLAYFETLQTQLSFRPTVFLPIWKRIGYFLGYASCVYDYRLGMVVTEAIEFEIVEHYTKQINALKALQTDFINGADITAIANKIDLFRQDEKEHMQIGREYRIDNNIIHNCLFTIIAKLTKIAIKISKKY